MIPISAGNCPACGMSNWQRAWADPYGRWLYIQCMVCGHVVRVVTNGGG